MMWIALTISVISLVTALLAIRWARVAHMLAVEAGRRAIAADERTIPEVVNSWRIDDRALAGSAQQHIATALANGESLSEACRVVIRALEAGGEPPTSDDYHHVRRCSDLFTTSVGLMRAPDHGDLVRELTDELVTLHHCVMTEVRQHQEVRYPFVGAKDTTLASQVLRKFDAELARLRLYAQTGSVPEPDLFLVDFETVRFVPRQTPGTPPVPDVW
jgi:hypothetical protein